METLLVLIVGAVIVFVVVFLPARSGYSEEKQSRKYCPEGKHTWMLPTWAYNKHAPVQVRVCKHCPATKGQNETHESDHNRTVIEVGTVEGFTIEGEWGEPIL